MSRYSLISVDLFQTLVDVNARKYAVWQHILGDRYSVVAAEKYWAIADELLPLHFRNAVDRSDSFPTIRSIFESMYRELFRTHGVEGNPSDAADYLCYQHSLSLVYSDAIPFLKRVGAEYRICLSSDTDLSMLGQFETLHHFDRVFTSQSLKMYKSRADGCFYRCIRDAYGLPSRQILHIGDSVADIVPAKRLGIATCWLNRNIKAWLESVKPDFQVHSLAGAAMLLGIDLGPA